MKRAAEANLSRTVFTCTVLWNEANCPIGRTDLLDTGVVVPDS